VTIRRLLPLLVILALTAAACRGDEAPGGDTASGSPSGGTGTTQAQADVAMGGLCDIATGTVTAKADVQEAFEGRAHEALHAVAAQAQEIDPVVAGKLLEAKAVVEEDLQADASPPDLPADAQDLVTAFGAALQTIGLRVPACPAT